MTCASGWVQNGGSCYLFRPYFNSGTRTGTWEQCNTYCPTSYPGATMLCVNNAAEDAWILNKFAPYWYQSDYYWIGYTDIRPYGGGKGSKQYGWVTGCSSTYTNWAPGTPDNVNNIEDYTLVNPYSGQWDDSLVQPQYCGCQYNLARTTTPSSRPIVIPSSGSTSSPTATPSFRPSVGDVSE